MGGEVGDWCGLLGVDIELGCLRGGEWTLVWNRCAQGYGEAQIYIFV